MKERLVLIAAVVSLVALLFPAPAIAQFPTEFKDAYKIQQGSGWSCYFVNKGWINSTNPDKFNASSVSACASDVRVAVEIQVYTSQNVLVESCAQGTVATYFDYTFCQVNENVPSGGSVVAIHSYAYPNGPVVPRSTWGSSAD